jgi:hypothetical protein
MNITIDIDVDVYVTKAGMVCVRRTSNNRTTLGVTEGTRAMNIVLEVKSDPPIYHLVELILLESGIVIGRKIFTPSIPTVPFPASVDDLKKIACKIFSVIDVVILMVNSGLDVQMLIEQLDLTR